MNEYSTQQAIEFGMLVLLVGREARGEQYDGMLGVAYSVRNRVENPKYWGHDWISVMTHPLAYSSMVPPNADNDPNFGWQAAAYGLAQRLAVRGLPVTVHVPPMPGEDFNDIRMRGRK